MFASFLLVLQTFLSFSFVLFHFYLNLQPKTYSTEEFSMKKILFLILPSLLLLSCKEEDNTVEEFANWQSVNETAFKAAYSKAVANTTDNIDTIRCYSLVGKIKTSPEDFIVVEKLNPIQDILNRPGVKPGSPLFTDSVAVSYRGRLQPSVSFSKGYVFDQSFTSDTYNPQIAKPVKFRVSSLVPGFTTALQNMNVGDHWLVHMPQQLGYGTTQSSSSSIPPYSMLTFEIILEKSWR